MRTSIHYQHSLRRSEDVIVRRILGDMIHSEFGINKTCEVIKKFSNKSRQSGIENSLDLNLRNKWFRQFKYAIFGKKNMLYDVHT
jgi:hypothetical protein